MTTKIRHINSFNIFGLIALGVTLFLSHPTIVCATVENGNNANEADEIMGGDKGMWSYEVENRDDPFLPFVKPNVATTTIKEEEVILTGMQLFEPGQLKLVAIMFTPTKKVAMVEDVTGKGYIVDEGTLIGRYGIVSQISLDQVNITETRKIGEKEVITPVVMRLDKEGDK